MERKNRSIRFAPAELKAHIQDRIRHLADEGVSMKVAADMLREEHKDEPYIITEHTVKNWASGKGIRFQGFAGPASVPDDREAYLREALEQAAEFVREHKSLPPVPDRIKARQLKDMGFDQPHEAVSPFSDLHYGLRIDRRASGGLAEYNEDIARERFVRWRNGVLRYAQISQLVLETNKLHVPSLGEALEGHGKIFGSQALQLEESVVFQVLGFVDLMSEAALSFLERFPGVSFICVPPNHTRVAARARDAYTPDNLELMAWQNIGDRVRAEVGGEWRVSENGVRHLEGGPIEFHIAYSATAFMDVMGWLCALRHGHGIKGLQATYTGAIDNKLRLNSVIGRVINYYLKAHLHEAQSAEHEIQGEIIQNGTFVGPSLLSIEMSRASASLPSQEFMLFDRKHGKTEQRRIHLAEVEEVRQLEVIGR